MALYDLAFTGLLALLVLGIPAAIALAVYGLVRLGVRHENRRAIDTRSLPGTTDPATGSA